MVMGISLGVRMGRFVDQKAKRDVKEFGIRNDRVELLRQTLAT